MLMIAAVAEAGGYQGVMVPVPEAILRMGLACVLGAAVGLERQIHGRAAGLRTMMLVSLGCCLVMLMSNYFAELYIRAGFTQQSPIRIDPARLAYGVMTGIGFLGAGVILKTGVTVRGLTTAATIWCVAAIGLACGIGLYPHASTATLLVLFALFVLDFLEKKLTSHWYKILKLTLPDEPGIVDQFVDKLRENQAYVLDVGIEKGKDGTLNVLYNVRLPDKSLATSLFAALSKDPKITYIKLE